MRSSKRLQDPTGESSQGVPKHSLKVVQHFLKHIEKADVRFPSLFTFPVLVRTTQLQYIGFSQCSTQCYPWYPSNPKTILQISPPQSDPEPSMASRMLVDGCHVTTHDGHRSRVCCGARHSRRQPIQKDTPRTEGKVRTRFPYRTYWRRSPAMRPPHATRLAARGVRAGSGSPTCRAGAAACPGTPRSCYI